MAEPPYGRFSGPAKRPLWGGLPPAPQASIRTLPAMLGSTECYQGSLCSFATHAVAWLIRVQCHGFGKGGHGPDKAKRDFWQRWTRPEIASVAKFASGRSHILPKCHPNSGLTRQNVSVQVCQKALSTFATSACLVSQFVQPCHPPLPRSLSTVDTGRFF